MQTFTLVFRSKISCRTITTYTLLMKSRYYNATQGGLTSNMIYISLKKIVSCVKEPSINICQFFLNEVRFIRLEKLQYLHRNENNL